jgi:hypothetical protein
MNKRCEIECTVLRRYYPDQVLKEKVSFNGYNLSPSFSRIKEPYHSARHPIIQLQI